MRKLNIDFLGKRYWFLGFSALLVTISLGSLAVNGLQFGIEFLGGTVIDFPSASGVTADDMSSAFADAGMDNTGVQSTEGGGFIVRTSESDPDVANTAYLEVVDALGLPEDSGMVTTIGPGWGKNITDAAILALGLSIAAILLYTSLRFEYKMSVTAVIALVHDIIITLGIYALVGREVTPNTIAALLTIMGYSIYDTIVVFHRMRENGQRLVKRSFMSMANESINQVIVRSINTSITSLFPVLVLLFFGGETLKDFAFALVIGLVAGAYSSIGVASPIYAIWKEREPKFQALKKKYPNAS